MYVGQAASMRRRVNGNRNPGPASQTTNNRMNPLMRAHLAAGETLTIAVATTAEIMSSGQTSPLNLADSYDRTLAESAAVVAARTAGETVLNAGKTGAVVQSG